jgi:hypothetical protein
MEYLLDPTYVRDNVDYSFGDQSGIHLFDGYMKKANIENLEFLTKCEKISKERNWMTVFIDNFRLYQRPNIKYTNLELINEKARIYKKEKIEEFKNQDLLGLIAKVPYLNFIIFTGFEDTPIDDDIFDRIPSNVLNIYASNCQSFGGKVNPIPYGVQRKLNQNDNRHDIIKKFINLNIPLNKLLYLNHSLGTNPERKQLNDIFMNKSWATVDSPSTINDRDYENYLTKIKSHKFMLCPEGNAPGCECSRDWEVIYMRRVPIVMDTKYTRKIFQDIPVLFVDSFSKINENFLNENDDIWQKMQEYDLDKLNYKKIFESIINSNIK